MRKVWEALDIPGGALMGIFTMCIIALSCHAYLAGKDIPAGVQAIYMFVMGLYGGTKTANKYIERKDGTSVSVRLSEETPKS